MKPKYVRNKFQDATEYDEGVENQVKISIIHWLYDDIVISKIHKLPKIKKFSTLNFISEPWQFAIGP